MALTGFVDQSYTAAAAFSGLGPAFLLYYSPAFLRTVAKNAPLAALQILATIYRGARYAHRYEAYPTTPWDPATLKPHATMMMMTRGMMTRVSYDDTWHADTWHIVSGSYGRLRRTR